MFDERVRERDLDHFLLEELHSSTDFRAWFLSRIGFAPPEHHSFQVERSPTRLTDARQTDLRLGFFNDSGALIAAVLIENKVTDGFQLGQAESYAGEIQELRQQLGTDAAVAVLVAPSCNHQVWNNPHFSACVSLEEITDKLSARLKEITNAELTARLEVKIELLEALSGKRLGSRWNPIPVPAKRDFAVAYAALLAQVCPGLALRPSSHGKKATTMFFNGFPHQGSFPCRVELKHELGKGEEWKYVNLQFSNSAHLLASFQEQADLFPADHSIFPICGGDSLMIRIKTPGIMPDGDQFEAQRDKVLAGMQGLNTLCQWFTAQEKTVRTILNVGI